jgi:hypothetical protein
MRDRLPAVGFYALTRIGLFLLAACAIRFLPVGLQPGTERYFPRGLSLGTWLRWDAWWYLSVAERGYSFEPGAPSNTAFFPIFPLVIRAVTTVTGNAAIAGLLVANAAAVAAVVVLQRWVHENAESEAADRAVRWLSVFPLGFFLNTVYAESLFLLLVMLSLRATGQGRWVAGGLWGGLAAATRPFGVLLLPAYLWGWWRGGRRGVDLLGIALIPAGLAGYAVYLGLTVGRPIAFVEAHTAGWGVGGASSFLPYWRGLTLLVARGPRVTSFAQLGDLLAIVLPVVFAALTVVVFRRLGPVPGLYTALCVAVAVTLGPESVGRELLAAAPAFAAMGLVDRGGGLSEGLRLLSFAALAVLLFAFATGHFVG